MCVCACGTPQAAPGGGRGRKEPSRPPPWGQARLLLLIRRTDYLMGLILLILQLKKPRWDTGCLSSSSRVTEQESLPRAGCPKARAPGTSRAWCPLPLPLEAAPAFLPSLCLPGLPTSGFSPPMCRLLCLDWSALTPTSAGSLCRKLRPSSLGFVCTWAHLAFPAWSPPAPSLASLL